MSNAVLQQEFQINQDTYLVETSAGIQFYMDAWQHNEASGAAASEEESRTCAPQA